MQINKKEVLNNKYINEIKNGQIVDITEGFLLIQDGDVYFLQNIETKKMFGPFLDTCGFHEGYAIVKDVSILKTEHWIIMDKNGIGKGDFITKDSGPFFFSDGYARIDSKKFINVEGKIIEYKPKDESVRFVSRFTNGLALVCTKSKFGKYKYYYIDKKFNRISNKTYDDAFNFSDDRAIVRKNNNICIIDKAENILFKRNSKEDSEKIASKYTNGLLSYSKRGLWGHINKAGDIIIEPTFNYDIKFSDDVATYNDNGNFYIIDKKGNKKLLLSKEQTKKYCNIGGFKNGYALLNHNKLNPSSDLVDKEGNITEFNEFVQICDNCLLLENGKKYIKLDDIKKLEKKYQIEIDLNHNQTIKTFDNEADRDRYYDILVFEKNNAVDEARKVYEDRLNTIFEDSDRIYNEQYSTEGIIITKKNN